jgi:integrase
MPKLTKKFIESKIQPPEHAQIIYRDSELRGFALRVTKGSMSYVAECRVNGARRRITIGPHGPLTPELARKEAQKLLAMMTTGHDPVLVDAKRKKANVTLAEVLDKYLASRTLRPNSVRSFKQVLNRCVGDWLSKPITSITKDMVEARHRELTRVTKQGSSGKAQANVTMERLGILINFAAATYEIDGQSIIQSNPVDRLSHIRAWHKIPRRQTLIPDHKLASWYLAVKSLKNTKIRDYLLLLLFTGLRRNEGASLRWIDIDLEGKVLTVRAEIAKNHREHRLPLSNFLHILLSKRKVKSGNSSYVFPGRNDGTHMIDSKFVISQVAQKSGCPFILHDLRRNFLTAAEKLDVPHYALRKLANHVSERDVTAGYIVIDAERLRGFMEKISVHLLALLGAEASDLDVELTSNLPEH